MVDPAALLDTSPPDECRWSLLHKASHAFSRVRGPQQWEQLQEYMVNVVVEGLVKAHPHHFL